MTQSGASIQSFDMKLGGFDRTKSNSSQTSSWRQLAATNNAVAAMADSSSTTKLSVGFSRNPSQDKFLTVE